MRVRNFIFETIDRRHWLNVSLRVFLVVFASYGVAALAGAVLARALPLPVADAAMAALMLSFLVQIMGVIWSVAARTILQACTVHALVAAGLLLSLHFLGMRGGQ